MGFVNRDLELHFYLHLHPLVVAGTWTLAHLHLHRRFSQLEPTNDIMGPRATLSRNLELKS